MLVAVLILTLALISRITSDRRSFHWDLLYSFPMPCDNVLTPDNKMAT